MYSVAMLWLSVWVCPSLATPPQHHGWLRLWEEGESCGECQKRLCPLVPPGCPAGLVQDRCGCCELCGNAEGQPCDPNSSQDFYGRCGDGLLCQKRALQSQGHAEPRCVCESQGPVCGSNGQTYTNVCQLKEASNRLNATLHQTARGPCYSAPHISRRPRDSENGTGNDIVFGCEVIAYPLPNVAWRKEGSDNFLPGDDPRVSVQARGGPQRYMVSTWLQIHGLRQSDAGVYTCISHNALGRASVSARLSVLRNAVKDFNSGMYDDEYFYGSSEDLPD